jgi:hypothetical protein
MRHDQRIAKTTNHSSRAKDTSSTGQSNRNGGPPPAAARDKRRRAAVDQRRNAARRQAERRQRRRRWIVIGASIAVLVALAAGTVAVFFVDSDGGGDPAPLALTSELVEGATAPLTISAPPSEYRVVYRVDTIGDGATTTEEFTVARPFDSRITAFEGDPPGGELLWEAISNLGLYSTASSEEGSAQVAQLAPSTAIGDFRLDATLADLVASGTFTAREQRRVQGRSCQVYRTGSAMETLQISAASEQTYSDVCIDEAGLLLEEMNVTDGAVVSRMIAISVDTDLDEDPNRFDIPGEPVPLDQGGSELVSIDDGAAPVAGYWTWTTPPAGYEHAGRYLLRDPEDTGTDADQDQAATTTTVPPVVNESYVDVYTSGADAIIVRQGPKASQPNLPQGAASETAGALGAVQTASGLTGSAVFGAPAAPADWFVLIQATASKDDTVALAASLVAI